jgi:hypothetical protein
MGEDLARGEDIRGEDGTVHGVSKFALQNKLPNSLGMPSARCTMIGEFGLTS